VGEWIAEMTVFESLLKKLKKADDAND